MGVENGEFAAKWASRASRRVFFRVLRESIAKDRAEELFASENAGCALRELAEPVQGQRHSRHTTMYM